MFRIILGFFIGIITTPFIMETDFYKTNHDELKEEVIENFNEFKSSIIEYSENVFKQETKS